MGRWEPNARGRLEQAALELYSHRGFDQTTVAEIAQRAGLTERTFYRYFADKREVLFWGEDALRDLFVQTVAGAPDHAGPLDAVAAGLKVIGILFEGRPREQPRQRQEVIAANTALQERELIKLAKLASGIAEALRQRGVAQPAASLAAETGVSIFKIAFDRWVDDNKRTLAQLIDESLGELKALAAYRSSRPGRH